MQVDKPLRAAELTSSAHHEISALGLRPVGSGIGQEANPFATEGSAGAFVKAWRTWAREATTHAPVPPFEAFVRDEYGDDNSSPYGEITAREVWEHKRWLQEQLPAEPLYIPELPLQYTTNISEWYPQVAQMYLESSFSGATFDAHVSSLLQRWQDEWRPRGRGAAAEVNTSAGCRSSCQPSPYTSRSCRCSTPPTSLSGTLKWRRCTSSRASVVLPLTRTSAAYSSVGKHDRDQPTTSSEMIAGGEAAGRVACNSMPGMLTPCNSKPGMPESRHIRQIDGQTSPMGESATIETDC